MVESSEAFLEADYKVGLLIAYSAHGTDSYLPSVHEDLEVMKDYLKPHNFDEIVVLKDGEATLEAVNDHFATLASRSVEHRKKNTGKKFLNFSYYSGHGFIEFATQRVMLDDCNYPLELKIRQFKNDNYKNTYNIGVFDSCRVATGDQRHTVGMMKLNAV